MRIRTILLVAIAILGGALASRAQILPASTDDTIRIIGQLRSMPETLGGVPLGVWIDGNPAYYLRGEGVLAQSQYPDFIRILNCTLHVNDTVELTGICGEAQSVKGVTLRTLSPLSVTPRASVREVSLRGVLADKPAHSVDDWPAPLPCTMLALEAGDEAYYFCVDGVYLGCGAESLTLAGVQYQKGGRYGVEGLLQLRYGLNGQLVKILTPKSIWPDGVAAVEGSGVGDLAIWPNPANGIFTVSNCVEPYLVEVFNARGERVYSHRGTEAALQIDAREWVSGGYLVKVYGAGAVRTGLFVRE